MFFVERTVSAVTLFVWKVNIIFTSIEDTKLMVSIDTTVQDISVSAIACPET